MSQRRWQPNAPVRRAFVILLMLRPSSPRCSLAQDQVTLRDRSAVSAEEPATPDYLAALLGARSRAATFIVLTNGDQIFPAMLAAIDGAKRRITFETYIYDAGEIADSSPRALEPRPARRQRQMVSTPSARIDGGGARRAPASRRLPGRAVQHAVAGTRSRR